MHNFVVIVVLTDIEKADVSRDDKENKNKNHEKDHSTDICEITKTYQIDKLALTMYMVDIYHQLHQFIIIIEAEHLIEVADTQVTKAISHTTIIADTRADHIVIIGHIVITGLVATIDLGTDTTIITARDRKAIIEIIIIITVTSQIIENAASAITVIITITDQITIAVTIQETIRVQHITPNHPTIETEVQIIITTTIMEVDTIVTIEIDIQVTETKPQDEKIIKITAINRNHTKDKVENIEEQQRGNETDPPGIDENQYSTVSSDEDQQIRDNFYNAHEDICNSINTIKSNPTRILPMYQCTSLETDFTKQKLILEIDFLLDSGATLNLLNEDTWNELKYNNPYLQLTKSTKTLTAVNNTKTQTLGTINLNLTPERISNNRHNPHTIFNIFFYITQCNYMILGTPFFKEHIETINVNTNQLEIKNSTNIDHGKIFFQNTTKQYHY